MYGVSPDYLRKLPDSVLPKYPVSRRLTLYRVADLEEHFARFRVG
jgi:hypothetical protein